MPMFFASTIRGQANLFVGSMINSVIVPSGYWCVDENTVCAFMPRPDIG